MDERAYFLQVFQIFLFLEQIIQCKFLKNTIFQIILSRNLKGPLISQLRKKGLKELLHEPISIFHVNERPYFLPNISTSLLFGTDNQV